MKTCTCCYKLKEEIEFYKRSNYFSAACRQCTNISRKEFKKKYPWKSILNGIKTRCTNPKTKSYKDYGERGIKCLITEDNIKDMWFRDNASKLKYPTINRKNNDGNYEYDNCEFIEKGMNTAERNTRVSSKPILQYDLEGKFIKEWKSLTEAGLIFNSSPCNINAVLKGRNKTAYGFIWRYKNVK